MHQAVNASPRPTGNQLKNPDSFVKYEIPSVVSDQADGAVAAFIESKRAGAKKKCYRPSVGIGVSLSSKGELPTLISPCRLVECTSQPLGESDEMDQTLPEILNTILPPIIWQENEKTWKQVAAITPASELDVTNLETKLNNRMKERCALEYGICPIRHELHRECFNELIRQMTVICAERGITRIAIHLVVQSSVCGAISGLLLGRIRDELDNTIEACRDIFSSATAFAMRCRLQLDAKRAAEVVQYNEVLSERDDLIHEQEVLRARREDLERQTREKHEADESKHSNDIEVLKRLNQQVKTQLMRTIAPGYLQTATARPSLAQVRRFV